MTRSPIIVLLVTLMLQSVHSQTNVQSWNDNEKLQLGGFLEDGYKLKDIEIKCLEGYEYYRVKGTNLCIIRLGPTDQPISCTVGNSHMEDKNHGTPASK